MAVISLRQALADQDHIAAAIQTANLALAQTLQTAGRYAVELHREDFEALHSNLDRLAGETEKAHTTQDYEQIGDAFRHELRAYRDKAARELARMRADLEAAAAAMHNMSEAVATSGAGHERRVRQELAHLEEVAQSEDVQELRTAIAKTAQAVRTSCEEVIRANALTIAQLRDEIRLLHQAVESERKAQWIDRATGGWNRLKADTKIKDLARLNQGFCVLMAGLNQLESADGQALPSNCREEVFRALLGRLESLAGEDALIGRWSDDVFAVIIDVPRGALPVTPDRLRDHVSGVYAIQAGSASYTVRAAAKVSLVERTKGMAETELNPRLGQAAFAVIAV